MKIVVTGADGFLGARAADVLETRGHDVHRVVRRTAGAGRVRHVISDLASGDAELRLALRGAEAVLHLAARAHVLREPSRVAETEFRRVNVEMTRNLARQAVEVGVRRFVFVSTIGVNGNATDTKSFVETDAPRPLSPYGHSKLQAEEALRRIATKSLLELVILRPPLVYGPGTKGNMLRMLHLASSGLPLPLASLKNRRNFLGLDNLCDALALCLESPVAAGETFLVAEPEARSTTDMLNALHRAMGVRERLFPFPLSVLKGAARLIGAADAYEKFCGSLEVDASKIARLLSWAPRTAFDEGILQTVRWYERARRS